MSDPQTPIEQIKARLESLKRQFEQSHEGWRQKAKQLTVAEAHTLNELKTAADIWDLAARCVELAASDVLKILTAAEGRGTPDAGVGRSDEYYLAMAALDNYAVTDDGLSKSTSVVFRIHQLGHELEKAKAAVRPSPSPAICSVSNGQGWHCELPKGHDGAHQASSITSWLGCVEEGAESR